MWRHISAISHFLIVCPKTVANVWVQELEEVFGEGFYLDLSDGPIEERRQLVYSGVRAIVVNYDAVDALLPDLIRWRPQYIVADESHLIKTPSAQRSRAMHKLGKVAQYRRILTGTPDPKNYADYYSQYKFLNPAIFGEALWRFRDEYIVAHPVWRNKVIGYKNVEQLRNKIFSQASRLRREDCMDIPEVLDIRREVRMGEQAAKIYQELVARGIANSDLGHADVVATNPLTKLLRLQQVTSGFIPSAETGLTWLHEAKVQAVLGELIEPLEDHQKVVIFCRFRPEQGRIMQEIQGEYPEVPMRGLNGDTPQDVRRKIQQEFGPDSVFRSDMREAVLVAQIDTGSLGVSFAGADMAIITSPTFDASQYWQARDRIWKPRGKLSIVHIVVPNTVDDFILRTLQRKKDMSEALLDVGFERATQGGEMIP
jgi:SNF2 family DNA or RNA helicase